MHPLGLDGYVLAPENSVAYRRRTNCREVGNLPTPRLPGTPAVPCVSHVAVPACSMCTGSVNGYILGCGARIQALGWMLRYLISSTPSHQPIWILGCSWHPRKWLRHPRMCRMLPDLSLSRGNCFGGLRFGVDLSGEMVATLVGDFV